MKTLIEMAREAGGTQMQAFDYGAKPDRFIMTHEVLEAFAALVRADERSSWPAEMEAMERQVNILTDALAEEREACWRLCDALWIEGKDAHDCREAIRARGKPWAVKK